MPAAATTRLLEQLDANADGRLDCRRGRRAVFCRSRLPRSTRTATASLDEAELKASHDRADDQLPNLAIPELNSVGAQEIFVTAAHRRRRFHQRHGHRPHPGVERVVSPDERGPSAQGQRRNRLSVHERHARRQGRSYVQLGKQTRVDYAQWCRGWRAAAAT